MADNCGQSVIRQRLADATRDELLEILIAQAEAKESRLDWFPHYSAADHRCRRLEQLLASRYHVDGLDRALHVADLEEKNRRLREEVRTMQEAAERHNREAWALGYLVHCTGCEAGGPKHAAELTEERVREVETIATRLRTWWNNHQRRAEKSADSS